MPEKILVIQTAFIGDLVLSTPLFKNLRQKYPAAKVTLFSRKGLGSLLKNIGLVDEVLEWNKSDKKTFKQSSEAIKKSGFDLVLCPHPSFRSALLAKQSRAPQRLGFHRWWNSWAFTHRVNRLKRLPESIRQMQLLSPLDDNIRNIIQEYNESHLNFDFLDRPGHFDKGAKVPEWASLSCSKWFSERIQEREALYNKLGLIQNERPWAAIAPGSVWGTKRYPVNSYHELAKKLVELGYQVLALGAPNEKADCEAVVYGLEHATVIAGTTSLLESIHILYDCDYLFTNDCGAMHLASLVETPTVSMFGPTVLSFGYRPWQNNAVVVQNKDLKCRPCHHHGPPTCPIGTHECMTSISPERVLSARLNLKPKEAVRSSEKQKGLASKL